ncbi:MAG: c-type cytochrome [Flavitalea sp.]
MKRVLGILFAGVMIAACGSNQDKPAEAEVIKPADTVAVAPAPGQVSAADEKGLELLGASDCTTCHAIDRKIIGPAYIDVSKKYEPTDAVIDTLVHKVKMGGSGHWGNIPMTAHPDLADNDIRTMVTYILSLKNKK